MTTNWKRRLFKKFLPWIIGLIYVISPVDIIPDFIGGIGWLDDIGVIGLMFLWFLRMFKSRGKAPAREEGSEVKRPEEEDPYEILGISHGSSKEEIKEAYVKLAAQFHPDKVQHLGKDFQELAHRKFVKIQNAYDKLIKKNIDI